MVYIFELFIKENRHKKEKFDELEELFYRCIHTNRRLWDLEDLARMHELGHESVALAKKEIDETNHKRNLLMREIDLQIHKILQNTPTNEIEKMYSESPGVVIDRISILFIKKSMIQKILDLIEEQEIKDEYYKNYEIVSDQIEGLIKFLDIYFQKVQNNEKFFKINEPIKVYNDEKVKKYIKKMY